MTRIATALACLLCISACGSDDGGAPALEGEAAVEAAAQAAVSLSGALVALLDDPSAGLVADAATTAGTVRRTARAIELACELGGVVDGDCRERDGRTVVTARADDCSVFDDFLGLTVTANGESTAVFEATGICGSTVPDDVETLLQLRGYREEWRDGSTLVRVVESSRFDQRQRPAGGGCSGGDGEVSMDGDVHLRGAGFDWSLRAGDLHFLISSGGSPCETTARVEGRLDVDDRIRGARFTAAMDDLRLDGGEGVDGFVEVALSGVLDVDCVGTVVLSTGAPLALAGACPAAGKLDLLLADSSQASVSFSAAGMELDYDADGAVDSVAAGCGAESLTVCR